MNKFEPVAVGAIFIALLCTGCATPQPTAYLALEKPSGPVGVIKHNSIEKNFDRGGWYFGNNNFRPAPDVSSYINQTSAEVGSSILKGADVILKVPFAFDILFFGYNSATDTATATGQ